MFEILDLLFSRSQSLFYFLFFVLEEEEVNLGNNKKIGYDRDYLLASCVEHFKVRSILPMYLSNHGQ
jgi:hypothetical protein